MRNYRTCPRPILKPKPKPQQLTILSICPQPPKEHREIPAPLKEKISPPRGKRGEKKSLKQAIDYDKLTPTQQARWDAGLYGSIHLRSDKDNPYYVLRWRDPNTKSLRSTKLGNTYQEAVANLRKEIRDD